MKREHVCERCGKILEGRAPNAKYCPECAREVKKEQDRKWWRDRGKPRYRKMAAGKRKKKMEAVERELEEDEKIYVALGMDPENFLTWKRRNPERYAAMSEERFQGTNDFPEGTDWQISVERS